MKKFVFLALAIMLSASGIFAEELKLRTPTGNLYGTLLEPANSSATTIILFIPGSGPTDRDGNNSLFTGNNNCIKLLAEALAKKGIASLRYDKRGVKASVKSLPTSDDFTFDYYVEDACAWFVSLKDFNRFKNIVIAGHGEGSLIGMLTAAKQKATGFISMEGTSQPVYANFARQLQSKVQETDLKEAEKIIEDLKLGKTVATISESLSTIFSKPTQNYLISWFRYNPTLVINTLKCPTLIVHGTTDTQVDIEEADKLAEAAKNSELLTIDEMNHVLKIVPLNRQKQMDSYSNPDLPVAKGLVEGIVSFVKKLN
jgi:hypothetical protein